MNIPKLKERKRFISLPADYRKLIYQPNNITNAKYSYTLIQDRLFTYLIFHLQTYIKKVMDGAMIRQLDIFASEENKDYIDITIPLCMIAKPRQYEEVRARAVEMISVQIAIPQKEKGVQRVQGLLTHVDLQKQEGRRSGILPIRISKQVAMLLLNIERDNGSPINYTSFLFDVALLAENKYTPRIYKLLSSWKGRGIFKIKLEALREFLQVGTKYKDYEAFKRRILLPVQEELKEKADFYFEISETREGKKVVTLNFIHKFPNNDPELTECKLWNNIITKLRRAWFVDDKGIDMIMSLKGKHNPALVDAKMKEAFEWMWRPDVMNNANKKVTNPQHYIVRTLLREFPIG